MKNMKYILEIAFIKFLYGKLKFLRNFFPFSCVETLQKTCVHRHSMKELPSQGTPWAVGLIAV